MKSVALDSSSLKSYDLVLLVTDHDEFDYKLICENARLIVDTRGEYADAPAQHIVPA